jgi:DNA-directed RNA polymerase subunit RPC12/RpoP
MSREPVLHDRCHAIALQVLETISSLLRVEETRDAYAEFYAIAQKELQTYERIKRVPMLIRCLRCKSKLKARQDLRGRIVRCPHCRLVMRLAQQKPWYLRMMFRSGN